MPTAPVRQLMAVPDTPDGSGLAEILRLLDLEDKGEAAVQAYSMRAAKALFELQENKDVWVPTMEKLKADTEAKTGLAVQWSPTSERTFHTWLAARLKDSGHRSIERSEMKRLLYAEGMRRTVTALVPRGTTLPKTEKTWRPAVGLYTSGYHKQLALTVVLAGEIAAGEGLDGITAGVMRTAKSQVWKSDPEIQNRGAVKDQATERDKAAKYAREALVLIDKLWKTGQDAERVFFLVRFRQLTGLKTVTDDDE